MADLFQDSRALVAVVPAVARLTRAYTYAPGPGMALTPGDWVRVRVGSKDAAGVVWGPGEEAERARDVSARLALPPMSAEMRGFLARAARYTLTPLGAMAKMAAPPPEALTAPPARVVYALATAPDEGRITPQQRRVLDEAAVGPARSMAALARTAGASPGVVKGLEKKGFLRTMVAEVPPPCAVPDVARASPDLSPEQRTAADALVAHSAKMSPPPKGEPLQKSPGFRAFVLDGVTGSGKTEVYFEAVAQVIQNGGQALILLPEIALTSAFTDRFARRFGCAPALWHSGLTPAQKGRTWRAVAQGHSRVVAGARSALFLPFCALSLIVVDEEHEGAYKQEDGALYHARDMAVLRAQCEDIPVVLTSATPSLETMENVWAGRYTHLRLPARFGGAAMPRTEVIDLRNAPPEPGDFLAPPLKAAVAAAVAAGEQALLFLNRRGYAPLTLCRACGHRLQCPNCSAWLVAHRAPGALLRCHHCGHATQEPEACPACDAEASWAACGPGVERVAEEVARAFPQARALTLASDTAGGPAALARALESVEKGEVDIIVGTQIVAKGHHFPLLTCVGVVDADLGLIGGELRAAERTFQLLHQVSGRAGRAERAGAVYLQTWSPDSPLMQALAAGDRDGFLAAEAAERRAAGMPPYARLVAIILSGEEEQAVEAAAKTLGAAVPAGPVEVFGPAPAPLSRLRGRWRWRLLARAPKGLNIQSFVAQWLGSVHLQTGVRAQVDVDPQTFL